MNRKKQKERMKRARSQLTRKERDWSGDPVSTQPRPSRLNPLPDPEAPSPHPTARPRGARSQSGALRGHSPARGRPGVAGPPSLFIVPLGPPAEKGTERASRKCQALSPSGFVVLRFSRGREAVPSATLRKLRLPAAPLSQGWSGGFRITLCGRSESNWLCASVAHRFTGLYKKEDRPQKNAMMLLVKSEE